MDRFCKYVMIIAQNKLKPASEIDSDSYANRRALSRINRRTCQSGTGGIFCVVKKYLYLENVVCVVKTHSAECCRHWDDAPLQAAPQCNFVADFVAASALTGLTCCKTSENLRKLATPDGLRKSRPFNGMRWIAAFLSRTTRQWLSWHSGYASTPGTANPRLVVSGRGLVAVGRDGQYSVFTRAASEIQGARA